MRILVVENDPPVASFLKSALEAEYYSVDTAATGDEALDMAVAEDFDLIILDSILPGIQGLEVLKRVRALGKLSLVLLLSDKTSVEDREKGLDLGADHYMTKPFSIREVLARVRALLRRSNRPNELTLKVDDLEMDRVNHVVQRGGTRIELSVKEFALLEYLMRNANRPITRAMIIEHVWDLAFETGTNVVDVYINYLRNKMDRGFDRKLIQTVRGVGYKLSEFE